MTDQSPDWLRERRAHSAIVDAAVAMGVPVFPCDAQKRPLTDHGFKDASDDPARIRAMFAQDGAVFIGMPTGAITGVVVVDIDVKEHRQGCDWLDANSERLVQTRTIRTGSGGLHLYFNHPGGRVKNSNDKIAPGIDVRGDGGYVIVPPSAGYSLADNAPIADVPAWLLPALMPPEPVHVPASPRPYQAPLNGGTAYGLKALEDECQAIARAGFGSQEHTLNAAALKIGALIAGGELEEGEAVAALLAAGRSMASQPGKAPWHPREVEAKVRRGIADGKAKPRTAPERLPEPPLELHPAAPFLAKLEAKLDAPDKMPPSGRHEWVRKVFEPPPEQESRRSRRGDGEAAENDVLLTEHGVALAFQQQHGDHLRYCHSAGAWFIWSETHWRRDSTHTAFSYARALIAEANKNCEFKTQAITGKASFAGGVERFARADQALAVTHETWDADPWKLGTPGGTVDLRTGEVLPARQEDFITKRAAVAPAATADCPHWLAFLDQATGQDAALIRFLQQWAGYCLTGSTREHALLFIYGPGGNGKSVFLNTVAGVLGDYCRAAPMDTFTASQGDKHPTDLAMLHGARLVTATETEEGRAWAEARIKQMTGGDPVTARFMRQDFFTYAPQFKLTIAGNHKPALKNVDEAAKRRFNIVPFLFKPEAPDRQLEEKLKAEWPAILRWMIEGCLDWQQNGLVRPQVVTDATSDYFEAQDVIGRWLAERCILDRVCEEKPGRLVNDCRAWAASNGETPPTPPQFRSAMEKVEGVRYATVKGSQTVKGIGLKAQSAPWQGERVEGVEEGGGVNR